MSITENDDQTGKSQAENEPEISLEYDEEQDPDDLAPSDAAEDLPEEADGPLADDLDPNESDDDDAPLVEDPTDTDGTDDEAATEDLPGGDDAGVSDPPENDRQAELSQTSEANDFVGLDDDEIEDNTTEQNQSESPENEPNNIQAEGNSEKAAAETIKNSATPPDTRPLREITNKTPQTPEALKSLNRSSLVIKIFSLALVALILTGFVLYHNPSLIGLTKAPPPETPAPAAAVETVAPVVPPVTTPSPASKRDLCLAKIEEAVRLRNVLLQKNEEIYELDIHYRNGIAELEKKIYQEIKRLGLTSYEKAMKIKHIELDMRTIQRRRAYINGLLKPAYWLNSGSEELFYLIRKAQLDLQLTEIAGGIDLNKHTRHINAAIQKYRPSPDRLAVDPQQSKVQPLEKIWARVSRKEPARDHKNKNEQFALNPKDMLITNQICSGNFERIGELTNISSRAARCLSRMKGSDLFLNGLRTLSPEAAQQLFQWQGNWICLNGVKKLSPAVARYLFKWKGNWISLNSLNDFPPELAAYLLKWDGHQLELMGLEYNKNEAGQKTLKYLARWETSGGKLFVTDNIRQKIERLM